MGTDEIGQLLGTGFGIGSGVFLLALAIRFVLLLLKNQQDRITQLGAENDKLIALRDLAENRANEAEKRSAECQKARTKLEELLDAEKSEKSKMIEIMSKHK